MSTPSYTAGYGGGGVAGGLFIKVGQDTVPSVALAGLYEQRVYTYSTSYQEEISLLLRYMHTCKLCIHSIVYEYIIHLIL